MDWEKSPVWSRHFGQKVTKMKRVRPCWEMNVLSKFHKKKKSQFTIVLKWKNVAYWWHKKKDLGIHQNFCIYHFCVHSICQPGIMKITCHIFDLTLACTCFRIRSRSQEKWLGTELWGPQLSAMWVAVVNTCCPGPGKVWHDSGARIKVKGVTIND